ncbi:MAG TPA: TIGR01459 family HAD-type hydrolase [Acidisphaera sp.]|nr:TIGR01459 family HAD-type hydrolase [Acidisphaera sp.]
MRRLDGFRDIAGEYDGFIVDLWGVLHDGVTPYPGAVACLEALRGAGKRVVLLSNAPRRVAAAQAAMHAIGIRDDLYDALMTSGEATHLALRDRTDPWFAALGRRVYHLGPMRDRNVIDGLDLSLATEPAAATFLLNTGPDDERDPTDMTAFEDELQACLRAGLPMVCANPDLEVIRGGVRVLCAGALAARYQVLGGAVRSIGKPDPAIYELVFALLDLPGDRVLAVGDSLRTDIAGAAAAGISAVWVLGGIDGDPDAPDTPARQAGAEPVAAIHGFVW